MVQGTGEAGILSSVNLDSGINVTFADSDCEVKFFDLKLNPIMYMDDTDRLAEDVKAAQEGNNRMEHLVNSKCLELNLDKCNFILLGNRKSRRKLRK